MSFMGKLGVGFVGAGPVTQAIHLPTLARLTADFQVVHVSDRDAVVAAGVAARVGAISSTSCDDLLADPRVDVVAICSPNGFHAAQTIAACRAGKKAVLCEKPFAMTAAEAAEIAAVSVETGVPILVGAMHTFDPGWQRVVAAWADFPARSHTIRSSIVLPPNPRFEDFASEVINRPAATAVDLNSTEVRAALVHGGVMGLAIHDLPLVRALLGQFDDLRVLSAEALAPYGYVITLTADGKRIEVDAVMSTTWQPNWTFDAYADDQALHIDFPPSYVQAGSGTAMLTTPGSRTVFGPDPINGYEGEWRALAALIRGATAPPDLDGLIDDLRFALAIADAAADHVRSGAITVPA